MEELHRLVQSLVIIIMLAVFLELLLPSGSMQSYVKMVMGLLVVIAVLQVVFKFLNSDFSMQVPEIASNPPAVLEKIQADAEMLSEHYQSKSLEDYRQGISKQVLALANLNQQVTVAGAEVEIDTEQGENFGRLQSIKIIVYPQKLQPGETEKISPVEIAVSEEQPEEKPSPEVAQAADKIATTVADFYNLPRDRVQIIYKNSY